MEGSRERQVSSIWWPGPGPCIPPRWQHLQTRATLPHFASHHPTPQQLGQMRFLFLIKIKDKTNERTYQIVVIIIIEYISLYAALSPSSPEPSLTLTGAGGVLDVSDTCLQTPAWSSQSLCWQNGPQYLATPHPLQVSVASLPQFQHACQNYNLSHIKC